MKFSGRAGMAINKKLVIEGARQENVRRAKGRLVLLGGFFVLCYSVVGVRAFDLSVLQHISPDNLDDSHIVYTEKKEEIHETRRADIVDRNGILLATSLETASLFADPELIVEPDRTAQKLTNVFNDLSYGAVLQKLQSKGRFVWLKRSITPAEQQQVLEIGDPGLAFMTEDRRIYPQGELLSHLVGYTNVDGIGLAGVERSFDSVLSSSDKPLKLSIDVRVQHILRREALKAMKDFEGKAATGVVMDVNNGEIIAAVSVPDFDPHDPSATDSKNLFNTVTQGVYELGSTFKIFSTAALLEIKNVGLEKMYDTTEPLKRGRFRIRDYHPEKRPLTVPEVFIHSSNIGSAMMGEEVGTEKLRSFYRDLGLMTELDFEIEECGKPLIPNPWREINTLTASYGHGIAVTPLHLVSAVSAVVNGGISVKPKLVVSEGGRELKAQEIRVISPENSHRMRQMMRLVVTEGTGKMADVPGYEVGGKTGTAEKSTAKGYDREKKISSFVGAFPLSDPQYAVFIMVDEPKGNKESWGYATGGWVGAPAVARVVESMGPLLGIPAVTSGGREFSDPVKRYIQVSSKGH